MSVSIGVTGGLQTPKFTTLAGAARTKVYDAFLSNGDTVVAVNYLNNTAGAISVLLEYFDGSAFWPMDKRSVAANGRDLFQDFPVRLRQNFSVHATGAANLTVGVAVVTDTAQNSAGKAG